MRTSACPNCGAALPPGASGTVTCSFCNSTFGLSQAPDRDTALRIRTLLEQGSALEAVRVYREATGASLRESRDAVAAIAGEMGLTLGGGQGARLSCPVLSTLAIVWLALIVLLPRFLRGVLLAGSRTSPGTGTAVQALLTLILVAASAVVLHRWVRRATRIGRTPPGS